MAHHKPQRCSPTGLSWRIFLFFILLHLPVLVCPASLHITTTSTTFTTPFLHARQLQQEQDWQTLNSILYNAIIQLPDSEMTNNGLTLQIKDLECTHLQIGTMNVDTVPQTSVQQIIVQTSISGLHMDCTARYDFGGFLIVNGSGDLNVKSRSNAVTTETVFESPDFNMFPPLQSSVVSCNPTVNIDGIEFSNGGFWGWTLDQLEEMFRGRLEELAENRLCQELSDMVNQNVDVWLSQLNTQLSAYPEDLVIDPLSFEQALVFRQEQHAFMVAEGVWTTPVARLVNWQQPSSYPFGFWIEQAWDEMAAYLNKPVEIATSASGAMTRVDMNANELLRQHVLEPGTGVLNVDLDKDNDDPFLYEKHDQWFHTKAQAHSMKIAGLDTLVSLDPLETIGNYTLQTKLAWKSLSVQLEVSVDIAPSTQPDTFLTGADSMLRIQERITIEFAIEEVNADVALLLALDQDLVEALQLGHLLDKDNILSCFLTSIHNLDVASLSVEAIDLQPPTVTGFVSESLDKVVSSVIEAGFTMYEAVMLRSSRAFFQVAVRDIVNVALRAQYEAFGQTACTKWPLATPYGVVDMRDLLLPPNASMAIGGMGNGRYGNLFADFVMPTLQQEILSDGNVNERFIRPLTLDQSGEEGTLRTLSSTVPLIDFRESGHNGANWVGQVGWENVGIQAFDAKLQNADTILSPVEVIKPLERNFIANTIRTGNVAGDPSGYDKPLRFSSRLLVWGESRDDAIGDMHNEVEVVVTVPSSLLSFDAIINMNEVALLDIPLKDLENEFCWLAATTQDLGESGLKLENIVTAFASFAFDVKCISCSSPGGEALPEIFDELDRANFSTSFRPHFELLLAEAAQGILENMNIPKMIQEAPMFCPHHVDYTPSAIASGDYGAATAMSKTPKWSRASLETISSVCFVSAYTGLFILAKNQLLTYASKPAPAVDTAGADLNQSLAELELEDGSRLLDWTNLSSTLGPWADTVMEEARRALQTTSANKTTIPTRRLSNLFERRSTAKTKPKRRRANESRFLQANSWIRDYLLDSNHTLIFSFDDDLRLDFAGVSFSFLQVRMRGLDTITQLNPFLAVDPHTLNSNIYLDQLDLTVDMVVGIESESYNMTMDISLSDVAVDLPLVLVFDLDKLGEINMENILRVDRIFACLLPAAKQANIPSLNVAVGAISRPVVGGLLSQSLKTAVDTVNQGLFDAFGDDLALAFPILFDTTIRRYLNTRLESFVREVDPAHCQLAGGNSVVDFRSLFLSEQDSLIRGGSWKSPYGDLFRTLHHVLNDELATEGKSDVPTINSLLASWSAGQSGVEGALSVEGDLVNTQADVKFGGLHAMFGFILSDLSILNVDSFGSPLILLDPIATDTLNNTLSFGVGSDPVKVSARIVLTLTDEDEMQVSNEINVHVDVYAATVLFSVLLRVAEESLLSFPLKDVTKQYCWLSTILVSSNEGRGIAFNGEGFSIEQLDLNISCSNCTSPQFGELLADLYAPSDPGDARDTVVQTFNQILDGDAIQDFFEEVVAESSKRCPHSDQYDPLSSTNLSSLLSAKPFRFTDFTERDSKSSYFNIANGIFAACLLLLFVLGKVIISRRNKKWKDSLSEEGKELLRQQKSRERQQESIINSHGQSLFKSSHLSQVTRWLVPLGIMLNIALYMVGHLGVISTVDLEIHLAGEDFNVHHFLEFSFIESSKDTYQNGGIEMSIALWIFTGIWPYLKLLASLFLWMAPPSILSIGTRGKLFLWIDALTKLSIIDIFTMLLILAVVFVYIGGPDESITAGALYSMKIIVVPGVSCYCLVIAQRMSRTSSRLFLDYHNQDNLATREIWLGSRRVSGREDVKDADESVSPDVVAKEDSISMNADREIPLAAVSTIATEKDSVTHDIAPRNFCSRLSFFGFHLGLTFGIITVLSLLIIGCIFAPSVSIDVSDLWGLALETDASYAEVASNYGVFAVVSSVLLKSQFVLGTTWDYVALGFLLTVAFVSVGMTFILSCFHLFNRVRKEGCEAFRSNEGATLYKLPSYLSRHAYKNMEVYIVAVALGCWQLGSVSIYIIHLFCSLLDSLYSILTYVGLAQASSAECYQSQMSLPDNLLIFFVAFSILIANFCIQCSKQSRKNVEDACLMLRHENHEVEHLSSLWNTTTRSKVKRFWGTSSRGQARKNSQTSTFSEMGSSGDASETHDGANLTPASSSPLDFAQRIRSLDDTVSLSTFSGSPLVVREQGSPTGSSTLESPSWNVRSEDPPIGSPVYGSFENASFHSTDDHDDEDCRISPSM